VSGHPPKEDDATEPWRGPGLFEAYGVEVELMIVDAETLDVKPVCDELIAAVAGEAVSEVELGPIAWSNELTLHVLELKTNGPAGTLDGLSALFHESVILANEKAAALGARLMPGAMHPWMDPGTETELWPHEYTDVYRTFDRIFGCSGHGWANLQSTHVNLPFSDDEEFGRLHAAIRLVLPLIPGVAASSPFQDGRAGAAVDGRLVAYRSNAGRVPSVTGRVVPEPAFSRSEYEAGILKRIYDDLAPHDPEGVLRHEWANARGAIARFDRGAIEIRVIDVQECPAADLAVVRTVGALVQALSIGGLADRDLEADPDTETLARLLDRTTELGERARIEEAEVLRVLGLPGDGVSVAEAWLRLLEREPPPTGDGTWIGPIETILAGGPLARRMLAAVGDEPGRKDLERLATRLCDCLSANEPLTRAD